MAKKRMFSLDIVDTDPFLEMPASTQLLYFHLGVRADDDGFVSSPKRIAQYCGCSPDDMKLLAAKGYIITFDSGVIVITDWKNNNNIRPDRYHPTIYQEEKAMLELSGGKYVFRKELCVGIPRGIPNGYQRYTQSSLSISRIDISNNNICDIYNAREGGETHVDNVDNSNTEPYPVCVEEVEEYAMESGQKKDCKLFFYYYLSRGWKDQLGNPIISWRKLFDGFIEPASAVRIRSSG